MAGALGYIGAAGIGVSAIWIIGIAIELMRRFDSQGFIYKHDIRRAIRLTFIATLPAGAGGSIFMIFVLPEGPFNPWTLLYIPACLACAALPLLGGILLGIFQLTKIHGIEVREKND